MIYLTAQDKLENLDVDTDKYKGKQYVVTVGKAEGGSSRVESFVPAEDIPF